MTTHAIEYAELLWNDLPIRLEYQWLGDVSAPGPLVVFLHEGLGSVSLWRDYPERFCRDNGFRGLMFSRYGYGRSTPRPQDQPLEVSYLHEQALQVLPLFLAQMGIERPVLFGHSDGGSIALLYASRYAQQVAGIVAVAPHIFVEDVTIAGIRAAREAYSSTDLRSRLAKHHLDVDSVFFGWNDAWLNPMFRAWNIEADLPAIACPVLAIQGEGDEYGTLEQIDGIARQAPRAQSLALAHCGHSPHRDRPDLLSAAAAEFIRTQCSS